jgi:hypothetical protein
MTCLDAVTRWLPLPDGVEAADAADQGVGADCQHVIATEMSAIC